MYLLEMSAEGFTYYHALAVTVFTPEQVKNKHELTLGALVNVEMRTRDKIRECDPSDLENNAASDYYVSGRKDRVVKLMGAYAVLPPKVQEWSNYEETQWYMPHISSTSSRNL